MKYKNILLIIIISLLIPITLFNINVIGTPNNIFYDFKQNVLIDAKNLEANSTFNLRNQTIITPVNWSDTTNMETFTDDTPAGNPAGWGIHEGTGCSVNVIASKVGHDMVLELSDANSGTTSSAKAYYNFQEFPYDVSITVEFWVLLDMGTENRYFYIYEDDTFAVGNLLFWMGSGTFYNQDNDVIGSFTNNVWYHIRIFIDHNSDLYSIDIDLQQASPLDSMNLAMNKIETIQFATRGWGSASQYKLFVDAIGIVVDDYRFENYTIGENVLPSIYTTSIVEIDKFEFTIENDTQLFQHGSQIDDPQGWSSITPQNDVFHYISYNNDDLVIYYDYEVGGTYESELYQDFESENGVYNVSWSMVYDTMRNDAGGQWVVEIHSYDETLLTEINILTDAVDSTLRYYDGSSYVELGSETIVEGNYYDFNLYLDSNIYAILEVLENDLLMDTFMIPLITNSDGLGTVNMVNIHINDIPSDFNGIELDYIGVYLNGTSLYPDGYAYQIYDIINGSWCYQADNIITLNATGTFSLVGLYNKSVFFSPYNEVIRPLQTYNGSEILFNIHDLAETTLVNASILLFLQGNDTNPSINSLFIEGVRLTDGIDNYTLEFDYNGVDINENYFYVLNDTNQLRYIIDFNDNNTEYIQATFNIPNLYTDNYTNSYYSFQYGTGYGYYGYVFNDATTYAFPFSRSYGLKTYYLTHHKTIDYLSVLITDNDNFNTDSGYGYINTISFYYVPDSTFTVITLSLMTVLLSLILLLVPSLLISFRWGKDKLFPMLILMTLVCFITSLIPAWLFFLMLFGFGGFILIKRGEGE